MGERAIAPVHMAGREGRNEINFNLSDILLISFQLKKMKKGQTL